jgi:hypothetical protein
MQEFVDYDDCEFVMCEMNRASHRPICPRGFMASVRGWPYCKNNTCNRDHMVGWNILHLQLVGVLFP